MNLTISHDIYEDNDDSSQELINKIENTNRGDLILIEHGTYKIHNITLKKDINIQGKR